MMFVKVSVRIVLFCSLLGGVAFAEEDQRSEKYKYKYDVFVSPEEQKVNEVETHIYEQDGDQLSFKCYVKWQNLETNGLNHVITIELAIWSPEGGTPTIVQQIETVQPQVSKKISVLIRKDVESGFKRYGTMCRVSLTSLPYPWSQVSAASGALTHDFIRKKDSREEINPELHHGAEFWDEENWDELDWEQYYMDWLEQYLFWGLDMYRELE
jgi:hypothetical protein